MKVLTVDFEITSRDSCDIGFRVQLFNAEFSRQVMLRVEK